MATHILKRYHDAHAPHILAQLKVLLPNRRGITNLKHALFRANDERPLLLPKMFSLGDMRLHEWCSVTSLPPDPAQIISPTRRMAWVTELVHALMQRGVIAHLPHPERASVSSAMRYAESFLALRDDCLRANIQTSAFEQLVEADYAGHWSDTLALAHALTAALEERLDAHGLVEKIVYQRHVSQCIATMWEQHPPDFPILAAGSTASTPATALLLHAIARLQNGCVALPNLDMALSENDWNAVTVSHPQYHLKHWLEEAHLTRRQVECILCGENTHQSLANLMMIPPSGMAELTDKKTYISPSNNVTLHECSNDIAEAETIALTIRDALHHGTRNILVVCDDTIFTTRIQSLLAAYNIPVNAAAGIPTPHHPTYRLLMMVAELLFLPYESARFLALLRHAEVFSAHRADILALAQWLDTSVLRGWHSYDSLHAVVKKCSSNTAYPCLNALLPCVLKGKNILTAYVTAHYNALQVIAGDVMQDESQFLPQIMQEFQAFITDISSDNTTHGADYTELLRQYFKAQSTPMPALETAPVAIMGALETRLHHAELVIIPRLNAKHWPRAIQLEPWLNMAMRRQLGLNFAERHIALAAHDLCMLLKAPRVIITRARKECDAPMQASRFFERLCLLIHVTPEPYVNAWQHAMFTAFAREAIQPPAPVPPVNTRMTRLSATAMEKLLRNPFEIYTSHICYLRERNALDAPFGTREMGTVIHGAMERAARHHNPAQMDTYFTLLHTLFTEELAIHVPQSQACFYLKRLERMLEAVIRTETARVHSVRAIEAETTWEFSFVTPHGDVTLTAKIDRIEWCNDGSICIIDHKTGTAPKAKEVMTGNKCQLLVAGMLLRAATIPSPSTITLEYWQLKGGKGADNLASRVDTYESKSVQWDTVNEKLLIALAHYCFHADAAFPWTESDTYATATSHFARVGEW